MKGEGLLKAATESIEAAQERVEREREADSASFKRGPTDLYGCDAERDRQIMEQIEQAGARDVENGV